MKNIFPSSYTFCLLNSISLLLIYAKIEDDLYLTWEIILSPTILFCTIKILQSIYSLITIDLEKIEKHTDIYFCEIIFNTIINSNFIAILLLFS